MTSPPSPRLIPNRGDAIGSAGTTMTAPKALRGSGHLGVPTGERQHSGFVQGRSFKGGDLRFKLQKMRHEQGVISRAEFVDRLKRAIQSTEADFEPTVC
jgi:hypothetical protein